MTKADLRKQVKTLLKNYQEKIPLASEKICQLILNSEPYKKSSIILSYMALGDEVCLDLLMEEANKAGKKIYLPRIIPDSSDMDFYEKTSDSELNFYGIEEPSASAPKFQIKKYDEDVLILVPGRAFSMQGARLGRGKGYYDSYLSKLKAYNPNNLHLMGVCFSLQIFDQIPLEAHDQKLDYIVTEENFTLAK
ncbi:MAG: 5-formyltetrahydrofolate cyclo-ligase [Treponema sp.]|nr:5-formyltetrahydrofolate cyclo-ligase [Treponema sp.]